MRSQLFLFEKKEPYRLVHQQVFGTLGMHPNRSTSLNLRLQNKNNYAPLDFTFSGELNFGQTIWDKTQVLLGASWGTHLGTIWDQGKPPPPRPQHPSQKEKSWTLHEFMLSLPIGCMKFLFPNLFVTIFCQILGTMG